MVEQGAVPAQTLTEATHELLRKDLGVEARRRTREVGQVEEPDARTRRRERRIGDRGHPALPLSLTLFGFLRNSSSSTPTAHPAALPASSPSNPHWSFIACQ